MAPSSLDTSRADTGGADTAGSDPGSADTGGADMGGADSGGAAAAGAIADRLLAPAETIDPIDLCHRWHRQWIEVVAEGLGRRADDPALPGKVRGALGHALLRGASAAARAGRPCPWTPPCALDVMLREQGRLTPKLMLPRPVVPAVDRRGRDLVVRLTVFGFATEWMPAAAEALSAAVAEGLARATDDGRPVAIRHRRLGAADGVDWPEAAEGGDAPVALNFLSPVVFRGPDDGFPADFPGFVANLGNRLSGLARWQDVRLEADWRGLKAAAAAVAMDARGLERVRWRRRSSRQGRTIGMAGWTGTVVLHGPVWPFLPLLALGATAHVGSHTALGLGRYGLAPAG